MDCAGITQVKHPEWSLAHARRMEFGKLQFVEVLLWRGSAHAFPFGEGGTASAVTEEVQ